ncbi:hypothetical protein PR048_022354 [Dryococelus australis]|uniref:Uncharacterized protein n=1 Tax=Dryococelus australis TaxID=614101 RepID=A0ABQ9H0T8_9NEOP|nr:hypothetical protein PR048_022354 [Dryococelus australis]
MFWVFQIRSIQVVKCATPFEKQWLELAKVALSVAADKVPPVHFTRRSLHYSNFQCADHRPSLSQRDSVRGEPSRSGKQDYLSRRRAFKPAVLSVEGCATLGARRAKTAKRRASQRRRQRPVGVKLANCDYRIESLSHSCSIGRGTDVLPVTGLVSYICFRKTCPPAALPIDVPSSSATVYLEQHFFIRDSAKKIRHYVIQASNMAILNVELLYNECPSRQSATENVSHSNDYYAMVNRQQCSPIRLARPEPRPQPYRTSLERIGSPGFTRSSCDPDPLVPPPMATYSCDWMSETLFHNEHVYGTRRESRTPEELRKRMSGVVISTGDEVPQKVMAGLDYCLNECLSEEIWAALNSEVLRADVGD